MSCWPTSSLSFLTSRNEDAKFLQTKGKRLSDVPVPQKRGGWPVVRLNAVEIVKFPTVCRLVKCEIGGVKEVIAAINETRAKLVATRRQVGVLLFGGDIEVQKAFVSHKITTIDLHTIELRRLWYESAEAGLIYDALVMALARERNLIPEQRRGHHIVRIDQSNRDPKAYEPLRRVLNGIFGTISGTNVTWTEAIEIRLAYRLRLWLVIEPKIWVTQPLANERRTVEEFQRQRQATRYNREWNDLLAAWVEINSRNQSVAQLSAFGIEDGVDATFEIANTTAFSRYLKSS